MAATSAFRSQQSECRRSASGQRLPLAICLSNVRLPPVAGLGTGECKIPAFGHCGPSVLNPSRRERFGKPRRPALCWRVCRRYQVRMGWLAHRLNPATREASPQPPGPVARSWLPMSSASGSKRGPRAEVCLRGCTETSIGNPLRSFEARRQALNADGPQTTRSGRIPAHGSARSPPREVAVSRRPHQPACFSAQPLHPLVAANS